MNEKMHGEYSALFGEYIPEFTGRGGEGGELNKKYIIDPEKIGDFYGSFKGKNNEGKQIDGSFGQIDAMMLQEFIAKGLKISEKGKFYLAVKGEHQLDLKENNYDLEIGMATEKEPIVMIVNARELMILYNTRSKKEISPEEKNTLTVKIKL